MKDRRREYRAMQKWNGGGVGFWEVQYRTWWWPFWIRLCIAFDERGAYNKSLIHSNLKRRSSTIVGFGKLPPEPRESTPNA